MRRPLWGALAVTLTLAPALGACGGTTRRPLAPLPRQHAQLPRQHARLRLRHARPDLRHLSLERAVGQTLIISFTGLGEPAYVARILSRGRAAGVILTSENVGSPAQVRALTRSLERSAGGQALVGADQEGGATRAFAFAAAAGGQPEQLGPAAAGAADRPRPAPARTERRLRPGGRRGR